MEETPIVIQRLTKPHYLIENENFESAAATQLTAATLACRLSLPCYIVARSVLRIEHPASDKPSLTIFDSTLLKYAATK